MSGTRRKAESLTPFVAGYRARLLALGYTPETTRGLLKVLGQLGRWMTDNKVDVSQLDWVTITRFLEDRRADLFGRRRIDRVCDCYWSGSSTSRWSPPRCRRRCRNGMRCWASISGG